MNAPVLRVRGLAKDYGGLRPLRIEELSLAPGEAIVVSGLDGPAAAVLVDLLTGTALPDQGEVVVGERSTASLRDHAEWLAFLDHFGILNPRVVLLDDLSVAQNLAVPFTLDLDPLAEVVRGQIEELAAIVGLSRDELSVRLGDVTALARYRVRLARAIAHQPGILLVEHPTLGLSDPGEVAASARALAAARRADQTILTMSDDDRFASAVATRRLWLTPASGRLGDRRPGRGWFRSG